MTKKTTKISKKPNQINKGGRPKGSKSPSKWTPEAIEKLGEELLACVEEPNVWHLSEFSNRHKHTGCWIYRIAEDYPVFRQYLTRAQETLGRKMFRYGMEENPNAWMLKTFLPRFLGCRDQVLEDQREAAKIKAEAAREAMAQDPNHPFWSQFAAYMESDEKKTFKRKTD